MGFPVLEIDAGLVRENARTVLEACRVRGVEPTGVVKGFNNIDAMTRAVVEAGFRSLASSRLPHLREIRARGYPVETMALRIPMSSELAELVDCADISLVSEPETIALLDAEAGRQGRKHGVVLMRDVGDLREGIFERERFAETARWIERACGNLCLRGIGTNLSCYGSVMPTAANLSELVADAREIERTIGRNLEIVSGGGSTSMALLATGGMPEGVTHMRPGGCLVLRAEAVGLPEGMLAGLTDGALTFRAEIVEIGEKPTHPVGELGVNCFGDRPVYEDRGVRRRALLAAGAFDYGSHEKLVPRDPGVRVLGCSSDHTVVDIHDAEEGYRLGDAMEFGVLYQAMLFATANPLVEKRVVG